MKIDKSWENYFAEFKESSWYSTKFSVFTKFCLVSSCKWTKSYTSHQYRRYLSLREWKSRHSSMIWKPLKIYSCPMWLTFICSVKYQILRCHFEQSFLSNAISGFLPCSISHSFNPLISVSLLLSSAYSPLYFYLLPFHINSLMIIISGIIE